MTLVGFAAPFLPHQLTAGLGPWLATMRASHWGPAAAILGFAVLATAGAPQIVLITALVAAFGPWAGLLYSWTGKLLACSTGFGAQLLARHGDERVQRVSQMLARRGAASSPAR